MSGKFVHLHTHSEYSLLDAACRIPDLLDRAVECGMDALALTDHGVLSGAIKFYREALRRGIKPIIGCEVYLAPGSRRTRRAENGVKYYHLLLLAQNRPGYDNLLRLVNLSHTEGFYYKPRVDMELLRRYHTGLIALSACESGQIPRLLLAGQPEEARAVAAEYREIFGEGNLYIELQDHGRERDKRLQRDLMGLATELELPVVATNDIHYLSAEDRLAHEVLLNIRANKQLSAPDRLRFEGEGYHFRTHEEMVELFSDVPEAIENTRRIAERCELGLEFGKTRIPPFDIPAKFASPDEYLRDLAVGGAKKRFENIDGEVKERLDYELSVIAKMNYATYFLIVWDFVRFAREHGIPVGPGRGSAAGSLVAYCIGITRVDPLKYDLIFERFLNPARISMPDFDIDFCIKGRERVIDYVKERYGQERMAQIATFDRLAARSAIRDVGRVLGIPYGKTDRLAKLVPYGCSLQRAIDRVGELKSLYENDADVRRIVDIGQRLEGLARNASTHAAGVVISADELVGHVPLMRLSEGEFVTQFDMGDVEAVGLLKFDFLGLRNLTLIDETLASLRKREGVEIDLEGIPLDDEKTYSLIRDCHTAGIFQLESSGMQSLIRRIAPDRFEDLVALLALHRPGPLESGMADDYVERRHGRQQVTYMHPSLEGVLKETYGLPIYQDQLMFMAQQMAGFSLAEADVLRKAMGKKQRKIMASLREKFISGCRKNKISQKLAQQTFQDMEKFARYGFNKSHTTAYAFVTYWTAYLKANYRTHFMASLLASVQGNLDKVAEYIDECRGMGIRISPPDINESERDFTPVVEGRVRFGLGAIKHVGTAAITSILQVRGGGFDSLFDLCRRVEGDGVDRDSLEALIKAGAFDSLGQPRKGLLLRLSDGLELSKIARQERLSGQRSFFAELETKSSDPEIPEGEFPGEELLSFEQEFLGLYISAHPLDQYKDLLSTHCVPLAKLDSGTAGEGVTVGGRVKKVRRIATRNGENMAFLTLEDGKDSAEFTVFPKVLSATPDLLEENRLIGARLTVGERNGDLNLVADEIFPLTALAERGEVSVVLTFDQGQINRDKFEKLSSLLKSHSGDSPLLIRLRCSKDGVVTTSGGEGIEVLTGEKYWVSPCDELQEGVKGLSGEYRIELRDSTPR
ncbi:MAG: DNA polymerase III subunit alpha [Candidatus Bipolaricaulota bacterium]|nr:DNA polymerase III subunit alpha [Candidatus Bipolaricaulota bacterium]